MKRKLILGSLFSLIASSNLFSQSIDSTSFITRSWKFTKESISVAANFRHEQMKKSNPAIADQIDVNMIAEGIKATVYKYNADGTYEITSSQGKDKGTWKLSDDKKSLLTKSKTSGRETSRLIIRISEKKLSLQLGETVVVDYEPAN